MVYHKEYRLNYGLRKDEKTGCRTLPMVQLTVLAESRGGGGVVHACAVEE